MSLGGGIWVEPCGELAVAVFSAGHVGEPYRIVLRALDACGARRIRHQRTPLLSDVRVVSTLMVEPVLVASRGGRYAPVDADGG